MITVEDLSKTIKEKPILQDISFEVAAGDCVALTDPSGVGKVTLVSCLLGGLRISKREIAINALVPKSQQLKEIVAVLPQEDHLPQKLRVSELIEFFKSAVETPLADREIDEILQFSGE